jgi:uncharacterized protein
MKYGIWLAVGVIAWLWFGHVRRQQLRDRAPGRPLHRTQPGAGAADSTAASQAGTGAGARGAIAASEAIVACGHCGIHVPLSEAIVTPAGARFCSEAHRLLHAGA